jgi:histidine triad (HIT) family protein
MDNCIFCQIREKKIPAKVLYEDDDVLVFPDIHPVRPIHLLIIPKQHIQELIAVEDPALLQKLFVVVQNMIAREGLKDKGYRVTLNGGGAQLVQHLHIHLMGPMKVTDRMG